MKGIQNYVTAKIILIGLAIAAVIFFIWKYFKLQFESKDAAPQPDIPNGGINIPAGYQDTATKISKQLKEVLTGLFTLSVPKEKQFVVLQNLTDDQLVFVYLTYNSLYFKDTGETMTQSIEKEWYVSFGSVRQDLVDRLKSLKAT